VAQARQYIAGVRDLPADPPPGAVPGMKLFDLASDLIGSECAGRHMQYEKFYAYGCTK
jgi:aromatic ring hydroxylase